MRATLHDALERILRNRRAELLREAAGCETALQEIAEERESEFLDRAQDDQLDRVLARLDDRERHEIAEIDAALDRIAAGTYGRCTRCGATIPIDRLAVLPEAALCVGCAAARERAHATGGMPQLSPGAVPPDLGLLSDAEKEAVLGEAIEADERIDHEELRISCRRGVVHLEGVLPSEEQHAVLRRLVEDVAEFRDVVDRIRIDAAPWEREDRWKAGRMRSPEFEPVETEDVVESAEESVPFVPPDRPPPEKE